MAASRQSSARVLRRRFLRAGFSSMGLLCVGSSWMGCSRSLPLGQSDRWNRDAQPVRAGFGSPPAATAGSPAMPPPLPVPADPPVVRGALVPAGAAPTRPVATRLLPMLDGLPPLGPPDANGVRLPPGFSSRVVARSGVSLPGSGYLWHGAPDGAATFASPDGGWIYVSNSELTGVGGVGALRFGPDGAVVDAYPLLSRSNRNCAGGATPWGTWLSCEEVEYGRVIECDPLGVADPKVWPLLGLFRHEAVAVDPTTMRLYMTEDVPDGLLYRYTAARRDEAGRPDLDSGTLEVLAVVGAAPEGAVTWLPVPDPLAGQGLTRFQVPAAKRFNGGEGIWYQDGAVYFTTKGDNRVWALDIAAQELFVLYDRWTSSFPLLSGVDNVAGSGAGHLMIAEDGGDLELVAMGARGRPWPLLQLVGHNGSEIAGPAFDPSYQRLYFSSQRGETGFGSDGITYEVSGPFMG